MIRILVSSVVPDLRAATKGDPKSINAQATRGTSGVDRRTGPAFQDGHKQRELRGGSGVGDAAGVFEASCRCVASRSPRAASSPVLPVCCRGVLDVRMADEVEAFANRALAAL